LEDFQGGSFALLECDFPTEACVVVTPRWIIEHIGQLLEDATCETRAGEWTMFWDVLGIFAGVDVGMDQYLLIPFLGGYSHPFTSYFDVHQGYKVLTHCHVDANVEKWCLRRTVTQYWCEQEIYLTWF